MPRAPLFLLVLWILSAPPPLAGQAPSLPLSWDLRSYSGTPPLLELGISEPESSPAGSLQRVLIESESSSLAFSWSMPTRPDGEPSLTIPVSPLRAPGIHEVTLTFSGETASGSDWQQRAAVEVGFVDFRWGRDNFRFGNNPAYRRLLDPYSVMLSRWLTERFGQVGDAARVLLVDYMYELFGKNAGRCYAFAGSQLRYYRRPDLMPRYYDSVYEVRARNRTLQRAMNELQMDMVFYHFVAGRGPAGPVPRHVSGEPDPAQLRTTIEELKRRIAAGEPAVLGLIAPDLHHSMVVYGYVQRGESIDLIAANNWKDEQEINLHSEDADNLRFHLAPDHEGNRVEWRNRRKKRPRTPDYIYVAEVREEYDHDPALLAAVVERRMAALREAGEAVLVVETADAAFLTDPDGASTGYHDPRSTRDLEEVSFRRVQQSYLFRLPVTGEYSLTIEDGPEGDPSGARLYYLAPASPDAPAAPPPPAAILEFPAPDGTVVREFRIRDGVLAPAP